MFAIRDRMGSFEPAAFLKRLCVWTSAFAGHQFGVGFCRAL